MAMKVLASQGEFQETSSGEFDDLMGFSE